MSRRHLYLVGFMAAGKSSVGRLVAARVDRPFVDLDELIAERAGRSIPEIFDQDGEPAFRRLEAERLAELDDRSAAVVATGGGLMTAAANRKRLRETGFSVWLDLALAEAVRRAAAGPGRPLWNDQNTLKFRSFFEKRRSCYALSDCRIEVVGKSIETVADHVAGCFERFFD